MIVCFRVGVAKMREQFTALYLTTNEQLKDRLFDTVLLVLQSGMMWGFSDP